MENIAIIESFGEFKDEKNIDRVTLMSFIEEAFRVQLRKKFETDENFDVIVNPDKGDLEIWRNRIIVKDDSIEDPNLEISYTEAIKIEPDFEVGEEVSEQVFLKDFGRRQVLALRQTLTSRILDLEKKDRLIQIINENFDLSPSGIKNFLRLDSPIYQETAAYGHFGREFNKTTGSFSWESLESIEVFKKSF